MPRSDGGHSASTGVSASVRVPEGPIVHEGIELWGSNSEAVKALAAALSSIGNLTKVVVLEHPPAGFEHHAQYGPGIGIFVGVKPVPE